MTWRALILGFGVLGLAGSGEAVPTAALGEYRAVLELPAGELPFGLELAMRGAATVGYLLNGKERVPLNEIGIQGSHVEIRMPGYENRLSADMQGDRLVGEVVLSKSGGTQQHIPLRAQLGRRYRFFATARAAVDVSGRWAVSFTDDAGKPEAAVGEFQQSQDVVSGTFLAQTGDHRYLAGDFWVGTAYHERFTGKRDANAALPDAYQLTRTRAGVRHFDFAFPDLAGHTVTSNYPLFKAKVMIVALAGSWCPNCHDEAAFLEPLYRRYRARGVEVVSLMFEHFGDFARAAEATQRFRQHYGIEYTTLIAGTSDKDEAAKKLPMLDRFYAFPTSVFIDRRGNARKIHSGFSGPATGDHYTQFAAEAKATLDQLLVET
jgi:hypothetical protein